MSFRKKLSGLKKKYLINDSQYDWFNDLYSIINF